MKLRAVEPGDARLMFEADNDEECKLYSDYAAPLSMAILEDYAQNYDADPFKSGQIRLIIETDGCSSPSSSQENPVFKNKAELPVGILDIYDISLRDSRAYVGIYILPDFRRKGLALEALEIAQNFAAERLCIQRLVAKVPEENIPSLKLFEKAGYSRDAVLKNWKRIGRNFSDIHILSKYTPN